MIGKFIEHYEVTSRLGGGGMGEVYQARDSLLNRPVAMKFLRSRNQERSTVERFLREARAASALNHPNIITIHQIGTIEDAHFIVMEFVQGHTLRELIGKEQKIQELVSIVGQIANALKAAHAAGIVHRDIKPENVMVRSDGYVKVLDFGLARVLPEKLANPVDATTETTVPGTLIGTMRYMSPEQARGERVSSPTDIFSLGIVLYELATGTHPFAEETRFGVMHAILSQPPIRPSQLNPALRGILEDLILQMLQKDANARPTAEDIESVLSQLRSAPANLFTGGTVQSPGKTIVGRQEQLETLHAVLSSVTQGGGQLVCVAGEPGIGKSILIEDFLDEAASRVRCFVGRGRCSERLAGSEAYLPLFEALENLLGGRSGEFVLRAMKVLAPTWYLQVATLVQTDSSSAVRQDARATSSERLKRELGAFLQEISIQAPVVLFLDDLHWADLATIDCVSYIAGKFDTTRLMIVGAYRTSELLISRSPFLQVKRDLQVRNCCLEIELPFLKVSDIERYLALEFPRNRFPTELAKVMHNRTEGSPLFVTNLVRYLRDSNSIAEKDGVWTLTQAIPDLERDFPESVRGLIQLNIGRLSDADKRLLVVASVQGAEFDSTIVAEVLRLNAADVEERLQDLDQIYKLVHLVAEADFPDRTVSLRYRFVHILYQNSLYASLTPTRRSSYAAAVAGLIQSHHGKQVSSVASALALLYEAARDFRKASEFFLMAAQNAARLFANKEAATLARRGLSLLRNLPDLENRTPLELGLSLRLGIALMTIKGYADPDVQAAYAKAHQLSQKVGESVQLFPILFGLWLFCLVRVEREMAEELAGRLLRFAESTKDPVLLVQAHSAKGTTEQNIAGEFTNSVEHFKRALEFYDPAQHWTFVLHTGHDLGATAYALMAWSYWCLGETDLALETARTGVRFARERAHPYSITFALTYLGMIQCSRGEFLEGKQTAEEVLRIARDEGAVNFIARGKMMIGFAMVHLEPTDEAIQQIREGLSIYKATGAQLFPWGYILLTEALLYMGRIDEAATTSAEAVETLSRIPVRGYEAEIWRLRGEVLRRMAGNEHEEAAKGALVQEAAEAFRHAIEVAGKQKARRWEEHAKDGLAALYNATS